MKRIRLLLIFTLLSALASSAGDKIKVACVGNSITYGLTLENREVNSYPAQLQRMLGDGYDVRNFGKSRSTLLEHGHFPYVQQPEYAAALEYAPDIVVIHLGVNDTDPRNWPNFNSEFNTDYIRLIDSFRKVNPRVRVLVALVSPLTARHPRFRSGTRCWRDEVQEHIRQVAEATGAELIDFDEPLHSRTDLLPDGVHPNAEGAAILARTAFQAITGDYGGLSLPAVYQSGMVLQRNQPLRIDGRADAGSRITVTLGGAVGQAVADNLGRWQVIMPPLATGGPYTMEVSDAKTKIVFTNILAGEVWLASGQSNMEFRLEWSAEHAEAAAHPADSMLRFYNMVPVALTSPGRWSDSIIAATDRLEYFRDAVWQPSSPETRGALSAVAYWFAHSLRDSLDVPVGVIINAVGGAPVESWTDVETLERVMPEALNNWTTNDYTQPWCQKRALENSDGHRHPYEPSYLFSAGIRPLGAFPLAGTIWYQGESNAHNIELHEALFPAFVDSWRRHFRNPALPVVFAQLSAIDRPSWPQFRDSQRRLAEQMDGVYMAVTYDFGDSLNVHPVNKSPVGERLARQALANVYRHSLTPAGPEPVKATANGSTVTLSLRNAHSLQSPLSSRLFELAGSDGVYHPATVTAFSPGTLTLSSPAVKNPRFLRYAWKPFVRPDLFNAERIPLTTFLIPVMPSIDPRPEAGMEFGVSGLAATRRGSRLYMAGGCNFPSDPLAPDSRKQFYRGVYEADTADMKWHRIAELPSASAYFASASSDSVWNIVGGTPTVALSTSLGSADSLHFTAIDPLPVDNAAAAMIGQTMYVAGGNYGGKPSRALFMFTPKGWKRLRDMPGNPRVQPVMAAAPDASGEMCLWLWGGFAPRHNGKEPTLELTGLRYIPSKNRWEPLPPLLAPDGSPLSVSGGAACALDGGKVIAVCGGVNKDIFLEALRDQAPDYLDHPAEWYRFNPHVILFTPATMTRRVALTSPQTARAGAAIVPGDSLDFYLIGGELRPRIRTPQVLHITLPSTL